MIHYTDKVDTKPATEPPFNVWSNFAYIIAGLYYIVYTMTLGSVFSVVGLLAGLSLVLLGVGSFAYHLDTSRLTHLIDHLGMQASMSFVALFTLTTALSLPWVVVLLGIKCIIAAILIGLNLPGIKDDSYHTKHSRKMLVGFSALLLIGLLFTGFWESVATAGMFGLSFIFHHGGTNTPTEYGYKHAIWHVLTAVAFALPLVWFLF